MHYPLKFSKEKNDLLVLLLRGEKAIKVPLHSRKITRNTFEVTSKQILNYVSRVV